MSAVDIIARKRDGHVLSADELESFIVGYTRGEIPDYQASAWLMAVYLRGMSLPEIVQMTSVMAHSGQVLDLSDIAPFVVDKHSTGGVGDKTTLVVAPLVASLGLPVAKMSGRGLGFTGGTIDKLESIPGFSCDLTPVAFREHLQRYSIVLSGQSARLAPADGKFYALRDVTATVSSVPLIASSIMSKKIASGANGIVLDVKVGAGAFMKTIEEARVLSRVMLDIGHGLQRRMAAVISNMNQPLGDAVGNALEVIEAVETLRGGGPEDFRQHCLEVATHMCILGGRAKDENDAQGLLTGSLDSGAALRTFRRWIESQGGDGRVADDPSGVLPQAEVVRTVAAPRSASGWVADLNAMTVGLTVLELGAGRATKGQAVDHAVGIVLHRKVGDEVRAGEPLYTIHARDEGKADDAEHSVTQAYCFRNAPVAKPAPILEVLH
jgi:pyrimidine-nucleoside phosphorylase